MEKRQPLSAVGLVLEMILLGIPAGPVQAFEYAITDLGTLGGTGSRAFGINNSGQVVGTSEINGDSETHSFIYSNGVMTDLNTSLGKWNGVGNINDKGQMVGTFISENSEERAFLYSGGEFKNLGTLGGPESYAYDINNSGQVVGGPGPSPLTGSLVEHAFLYSGETMKDLGTLGGTYSEAHGINTSGQVVGVSAITGDTAAAHAFLYSDEGMQDLGTLGGKNSVASKINDSGQIVGFSEYNLTGDHHAFLWSGSMKDLGTLGGAFSYAWGINAGGQVVGTSWVQKIPSPAHAFIYSDNVMTDLNTLLFSNPGWTLVEATAINDLGQIVGYGFNPDGNIQAYLLTPTPEPMTVVFFLLGGLAILRRRK
jgi:probable HAF family extracellular repeat protein